MENYSQEKFDLKQTTVEVQGASKSKRTLKMMLKVVGVVFSVLAVILNATSKREHWTERDNGWW